MHIIADETDFVVVEKPAGMNFHSEDGEAGFVVQVQQQLHNPELRPVHRLDKMTSGLVILAKSAEAAATFERLFRERQIEKTYVALSDQKPKKKQGWVKGDMEPSRRGSWKLLRTQQHPAVTYFTSESVKSAIWEKERGQRALRLFWLYPKTGRTHQLRVMMKSLGSPILGDARYGSAEAVKLEDRGYLHAYALKFDWQGESKQFVSPPKTGKWFEALWKNENSPFGR